MIVLGIIDVFYQNGEFAGMKSSLINLSHVLTLLGMILTLVVLQLKFDYDRKVKAKAKEEFEKEGLLYFKSLVESVAKTVAKEIENLQENSRIIFSTPLEFATIPALAPNDIDRISNKLNLEKVYHAYINNIGGSPDSLNNYRKIISSIDWFGSMFETITNNYYKAQESYHSRKRELRNKLIELEEYIKIESYNFREEDETMAYLHSHLYMYIQKKAMTNDDQLNLEFYKVHFVTFFKDILSNKDSRNEKVMKIYTELLDIERLMTDVVQNNRRLGMRYVQDYKSIELVKKKFDEARLELQEWQPILP